MKFCVHHLGADKNRLQELKNRKFGKIRKKNRKIGKIWKIDNRKISKSGHNHRANEHPKGEPVAVGDLKASK